MQTLAVGRCLEATDTVRPEGLLQCLSDLPHISRWENQVGKKLNLPVPEQLFHVFLRCKAVTLNPQSQAKKTIGQRTQMTTYSSSPDAVAGNVFLAPHQKYFSLQAVIFNRWRWGEATFPQRWYMRIQWDADCVFKIPIYNYLAASLCQVLGGKSLWGVLIAT